jgi:hypothetical protein
MASDVHTQSEPGLASLVKGIVSDVGELIKQQFQFAHAEVKSDLRKTGQASVLLGVGLVVALLGLVVLCFMPVHLLHWATSPEGTDPAAIPLWGCYGIVGAAVMLIGGALAFAGKKRFDSFNPLPDETVKAIQENLQWTTNSK